MFQFEFDEATGILRVRVLGTWTLAEVERYGREAAGQFAAARRKAGSLLLLIDCSQGYICPQALVDPLARAGMQHARHDDRAALVVNSSLMKLQVKRMTGDAPNTMFISEGAAQTWLTAHEGAGQAKADAA